MLSTCLSMLVFCRASKLTVVICPGFESPFSILEGIFNRLAVHNSSFMINTLNIKSSVHRQKLRLNALDVVLFGYRDSRSRFKDIILALLVRDIVSEHLNSFFQVTLLTGLGYLFWRHKRRAAKDQQQLREKLDELKTMESDWLQQQRFSFCKNIK